MFFRGHVPTTGGILFNALCLTRRRKTIYGNPFLVTVISKYFREDFFFNDGLTLVPLSTFTSFEGYLF